MSFERPLPPPLPPQGFLLDELGYLDEQMAAIALDVALQTLIEYRKGGIGPDYAIVGRTVFYSPGNLKKWLEAGGTRASIESGAIPAPVKPRRQAKAAAKSKAARLTADA